jgi:REP element-mobilizing transposase RayT
MLCEGMARARKHHQQTELVFRTWGGKRRGAGRRPNGRRSSEKHTTRPPIRADQPLHINTRFVAELGNMRMKDTYDAIRSATRVIAAREDFRIVHASIQRTHLHLIVEADSRTALNEGMQAFLISAAMRVRRAIRRRTNGTLTGPVFADRYHERPLASPREVRNAIHYVLNNWRHHAEDELRWAREWRVDPFSSGPLFQGWKESVLWIWPPTYEPLVVWAPRTWLLAKGWTVHGPISVWTVPAT